ncbi:hypothetical protein [Pseudactinotalea terrae]|uniref:hypothetical protein n=1 Tax=Pseudactinotalea terrae TaxID=1743262 RepID=UPI0012E11970|nr:hypothetical protein [Pseudactinotalea terrae]
MSEHKAPVSAETEQEPPSWVVRPAGAPTMTQVRAAIAAGQLCEHRDFYLRVHAEHDGAGTWWAVSQLRFRDCRLSVDGTWRWSPRHGEQPMSHYRWATPQEALTAARAAVERVTVNGWSYARYRARLTAP